MSDIRIYLVEDQGLIRESLRAVLELEPGIKVVGEAAEADQALRELDILDADVVLMDIGLPGKDGIEATRLLKRSHQNLVVVMLTSYEDEYVTEAFAAGASGYALKSCTRRQLIEAIRTAYQGQVPIDTRLTGRLLAEMTRLKQAHQESLLNPRQLEILKLVAQGVLHRDIATRLFVSETTVNREMHHIFNQLGVNDAAHAVSMAHKAHLI